MLNNIFDPYYRDRVMESIRNWLIYYDHNNSEIPVPKTSADLVRKELIEPVERWIKKEWQRLKRLPNFQSNGNYIHIEAANNFLGAAEDLEDELKKGAIYGLHINQLEKCWMEFQIYNPDARIGNHRSEKQKLNRAKRETWKGKKPTERQERNHAIYEQYKKTKLSVNSFATRNAKKYDLSSVRIRKIIDAFKGKGS